MTRDGAEASDTSLEVTGEVVEPLGLGALVLTRLANEKFWQRLDGQSAVKSGDTPRIGILAKDASLFDARDEMRL